MTLTYKEQEIELSLEAEEFHLTLGPNQHAYFSMKRLVKEQNINDYVNLASVLPVTICKKMAAKGAGPVPGQLENVSVQKERGLWYLHLDAYSYTKEWERVDKSRSFLDGAMTYLELQSYSFV